MILYTAELELPPADLEAFGTWYAGRHAPDLYQAGFQICTSYRAVEGSMNVLNLYQLPNWDIFQSPVYRQVGPKDVYGGPLMAGARDKANTPYASRLTIPTAELDSVSYVDADWLSVFRFAATERTEDDIAACLHDGEAAWLIASGSKRLHLTHRTAPHPHAPSHRPRCALFIEWPERPPAGHAVPPVIAERFADSLSATSMFMGYRVYPWPDRIRPA